MTKNEAKSRIIHLKKEIEKYRRAYHERDISLVSDDINDSLKKELGELERQFPEYLTADSPSERVGGVPLKEFKKITRSQNLRMNSLNDAFSEEDIRAWAKRVQNYLNIDIDNLDYYVDLKMDGLALEIYYLNGIFEKAATRGDGIVGEDVTQNVKTIESIPLILNEKSPKNLIVRGEIFLTKSDFL